MLVDNCVNKKYMCCTQGISLHLQSTVEKNSGCGEKILGAFHIFQHFSTDFKTFRIVECEIFLISGYIKLNNMLKCSKHNKVVTISETEDSI